MTEKERLTIDKFNKYLHENACSHEFLVAIMQLAMDYSNSGSVYHLSKQQGVSHQHIHKTAKSTSVNGITIYTKPF